MFKIDQVRAAIEKNREEMLEKWIALIEKCGAAEELARMDDTAGYIKRLFEEEGFTCILKETGKNCPKAVIGTRNYNEENPPVIFSGHYDTVFHSTEWNTAEIIEQNKLHGPGALDMKGGIIVALFTSRVLREMKCQIPIKVVFVGDEEIGHAGSIAAQLLKEEAKGARCAFNMETGFRNNDVCIGRKGTAIANIEIRGKSSHPGNAFEDGINAIEEGSKKIIEIQKLTNLSEGMSASVDTINGGTASNVIPDTCRIQVDLRFSTVEQFEMLQERIRSICQEKKVLGTYAKVEFAEAIMPFVYTQNVQALFEAVQKAATACGQRCPNGLIRGGASDAAYIQMAEIPVVCAMGVSGEHSHSKQEFAIIKSLEERTELLATLLGSLNTFLKE